MTEYTAEQINEAVWDLYRHEMIKWREDLDPETVKKWEDDSYFSYRLNVDIYRRPYSELSYSEKLEFPGYGGWTGIYTDGVFIIDGVEVPYEFVSNDDEEFMSRVKITIKVGDQYFVKQGRHISHDGTYWDGDVYEATPRTVTYTEWDRK